MKEDIENILVNLLAWAIGAAGWVVCWFLAGVVARLTWIPLSFGWNLI